ncbi:MAG: Ldh family oxidoreductase [Chloroflexi bacterium]|nr:Ldh family oxidoreductase [Chloroflexota bacterium]
MAAEIEPAVRVTVESLRAYGVEAFERAGLPPEGAAIVTEVQLEASLRGQPTHNVGSIPGYAKRIKAGGTNARPDIRVVRESGVHALVDGDNGQGQWVSVVATRLAMDKARATGIGVVGVRNSNHFGAAGHYAWMATQERLIGLCTTNGGLVLAPTGGITPTFGNNPLGVGIPARRHHPIVLDIAMSVVAQGKIALQIAEGKPIPPGWMVDKLGRPSTNPADFAEGFGVPIAGHKGYGLTLVMETLAGLLTGAAFGWDHSRERTRNFSNLADIGHFFLAINPALFLGEDEFLDRVDRMIDEVKAGEKAEGVAEVFAPGEPEMRARAHNLREGVPILPSTYRALLAFREEWGLATELEAVATA